ncbi:hypothetical protein [Planococcus koreensis]|uniref:hypothetical protein n=1 Tax=Planococcus koreensis TaxID=112331 RepID=UPI0039FDA23B
MKMKKTLLIASLAVNVLLIGAAGVIVNKQGGMGFIEEQYQAMKSKEEFPEYYRQKKIFLKRLKVKVPTRFFSVTASPTMGISRNIFRMKKF